MTTTLPMTPTVTLAYAMADPMADQTTWTTHGVSDAERAAIVAAAAMIGRTFRYRGGTLEVTGVADCRPALNGAIVTGVRTICSGNSWADGSAWVADLGAEVVR